MAKPVGADAAILGNAMRINGTSLNVIGAAPQGFAASVAVSHQPAAMLKVGYRYCDALSRRCAIVHLIGRLHPSASPQDAEAELNVLARQPVQRQSSRNAGRVRGDN